MIGPEDLSLFRLTDSVEETVAEILRFYRVFHNMQYENNRLVLRLHERLHESKVQALQSEFRDILASGEFRQDDEPENRVDASTHGTEPTASVRSRLVFHFNRRSLGRLRQLIDAINND